jgi:hypothetical protein
MGTTSLASLGLGNDDLTAIGKLSEKELTPDEIADAVEQAHLSKDAINKIEGLEANSLQINYLANEERKIPVDFDISLLPYFRVWKNKLTRTFETNIKTKKIFEDIFADKIVYVDIATGNDTTGTGTISNPYKTIYKGVRTKPFDPASGGNLTVYVKAGIYSGADGFNATGAYVSNINIIGYGGLVYATHTTTTTYGYTCFETINHYVENIIFSGGKATVNMSNSAGNNPVMMFKNCAFNDSTTENGINVRRNGLYIFENCKSNNNFLDGFNYHNNDSIKNQLVIEINCKATGNGTGGGTTDNGSTMHDTGNIIRINGEYYGNSDRNIHDIENSKSWNLGVIARDGSDVAQANFVSGNGSGDITSMYLDTCSASGSNKAFDLYSNTTSFIYTYDFEDTCTTTSTYTPIAYDYKA